MLSELLVIVGAEVILLLSIAAMTLYDLRMDVLSGRYFSNQGSQIGSPDWTIDWLTRLVERERKMHRTKSLPVRASNERRRPLAPLSDGRIVETIFLYRRLTLISLIAGLSDIMRSGTSRIKYSS